MQIEKDIAIPIELKVWQIPSEFGIMTQYYDCLLFSFKFWNENKLEVVDKIANLFFKGVWTMKFSRFNKYRYYKDEIEHSFHSNYWIIPNSSWLEELKSQRKNNDKKWEDYDKRNYKHYIVQNNAYYIEIIADNVEFYISNANEIYNKIWEKW